MENNHIPTDGKASAGSHTSFWLVSTEPIRYAPLRENLHVDVVVVGGGIAGVTTAYCLSKAGKRVALVEDGYIGSGETGRTTAHLTNVLDDRYYELERIYGEEISKLAAQSHAAAIDFMEKTVREENIDCDFRRVNGYLLLHPSDEAENIEREYEAAQRAGLQVEKINFVPGLLSQPGTMSLQFGKQAQFHVLHYIKGLCERIVSLGGKIFTETHAQEIQSTGIISHRGYRISAHSVVVATNAPVTSKYILPLKQFAYRTYAIAALVEKASLPPALWWDTGDHEANSDTPPYHYIRTEPYDDRYDLLISGGEDHPTGLADAEHVLEEQRYEALIEWTKAHFAIGEVKYRWSGQVMEPIDCLGYIGSSPGSTADNIYIVSGDSGNGMTHGTLAGILLTDLITGKKNPWEDMYSPARFKLLKTGGAWVREFVKGYLQYIKYHPTDVDATQLSQLPTDHGCLVKLHGHRYGAYRDAADQLHLVDAACTHLGCTIKWNNDEKTWDCPCHGSRFSYKGQVLNGPANSNLPYHAEQGDAVWQPKSQKHAEDSRPKPR